MGRKGQCGRRCHEAKKPRCRCWCGGAFHGAAGAANLEALVQGETKLLEEHGFKQGETVFKYQPRLPIGV